MQVRPLTRDDIDSVYDAPLGTVKGVALVDGDRIVGVAGIMYGAQMQCFSTIVGDGVRTRHAMKVIARDGIPRMREILNSVHAPVYALASELEPTADGFLKHVGFKPLNDQPTGVYVWQTQ